MSTGNASYAFFSFLFFLAYKFLRSEDCSHAVVWFLTKQMVGKGWSTVEMSCSGRDSGKRESLLHHLWAEKSWEAYFTSGFPGVSDSKESVCNTGDQGLIPGSGRSPREGNGNPLQYSCLGNPRNREAWRAIVQEVAKSRKQLSGLSPNTHT